MTTSLLDARAKLGAVLAPVADTDPVLHTELVDSLEPPCLMLGWGEPWLTHNNARLSDGRLTITCVAGRLVPGAGVETLERLVHDTLSRLLTEGAGAWPMDTVSGPRVFTIGNVNYLAARITVRATITGG